MYSDLILICRGSHVVLITKGLLVVDYRITRKSTLKQQLHQHTQIKATSLTFLKKTSVFLSQAKISGWWFGTCH